MEKEIDMTSTQIIKALRALLATDRRDDFLEACRIFNSIEDDETFDRVYVRMPSLINYDAKGNYVGSYYNENGWTA